MLVIEYIMSFVHIALTICELYGHMWPIILYCLGLVAVVRNKQCCLQTNKYDQSLLVTDILQGFITICYFVFELG